MFVDTTELNNIKNESNEKTEKAFLDFSKKELQGKENTRADSAYMAELIRDNKATNKAVDYLKAKSAMYYAQLNTMDGAEPKTEEDKAKQNEKDIQEYGYALDLKLMQQLIDLQRNLSDALKELPLDTLNFENNN